MGKSKRIWRESQHPRDGRGRFSKRGGAAWVKRAAAELASAPGSGDTRSASGRPQISRSAKAGVVLQAHTDGGRPSVVRAPQATVTRRDSPAGLAMFNAKGLPTPKKTTVPQPKNLAAFNAPDPVAPKKRTPRQSPGAAALIAARANEQAPQTPAMVAARTTPEAAPVQGAEAYAAMRRHTLLALARDAKIGIRGKSNTQIANELAAHDEQVKAARAAKLNPSGVGKVDTPRVGSDNGGMTSTTSRPVLSDEELRSKLGNSVSGSVDAIDARSELEWRRRGNPPAALPNREAAPDKYNWEADMEEKARLLAAAEKAKRDAEKKAAPGADTEHLKRPKAKKGDLVVVERKTSSNSLAEGRTEGVDIIVGVVTSTNRDGIVTGYSTYTDGTFPKKVNPARERTLKLEAERVDVQAAMEAAAANPWPQNPGKTGKPFASLEEARAAIAPHLGDQEAKRDAGRKAQEVARRAEHEADMEAKRAALRAKTPAGVRPGDGRPSIGTITSRSTNPREKWNLGNTPGTAGSAPNMVISPVGHIDNREANARIMNPLTPDGPYRYEIRDENTGEIIESGEDRDLDKVYARANRIMSRTQGGGMARTEGKSTRFEARTTERPKDSSRGDFGKGPFYEHTVVEIDQDGNETVRVQTSSAVKAEAHAVEMNAKEQAANPKAAPEPGSDEAKLAAKRAELEAAQARFQREADWRPSGGMRTKSFGVRVDANLRRAGEAGRDIERLEHEIKVLELRTRPKKPVTNDVDGLEPGDLVKMKNGLTYKVAKVNAKSVKVVVPPGMDDLMPKSKIVQTQKASVTPPKVEAPAAPAPAKKVAPAAPAAPQPTFKVRRDPVGFGGLIRHELVQQNPDGTEVRVNGGTDEGALIKQMRRLKAEQGPVISSAKLETEEAKLRARLDAMRAKRAGNTRKKATQAELDVIERLQNLAPQLARSRREEKAASERANPRGLGGMTGVDPKVLDRLIRDNLANGGPDDRSEVRAAEAVANGTVPIRVASAALHATDTPAEFRKALGIPEPTNRDKVMEVDASEVRLGDIVNVGGLPFQVTTITGTGDTRQVSGRNLDTSSLTNPRDITGRVKLRRPAGGASPKADAAPVAAPARARITPDAKRGALDKANADATTAKRAASLEKARTAQRDERRALLNRTKDPKDNSAKIKAIEDGTLDSADLYRTAMAGPSGQRAPVHVGRVRHTPDRPEGEFEVTNTNGGDRAGWATRVSRNGETVYAVHSENADGGTELLGWADTLAHAADVLTNGEAAASTGGTLDARRISGRMFERNPNRNKTLEQLDREALDREIKQTRESLDNPRIGPSQRASAEKRLARLKAERRGEPETPRDIGGIEELKPFRIDRPQDGYDAHGASVRPGDTVTIATDRHNRTDEKVRVLDVGIGRTGGSALATVRYDNGDREQLLLGNLVRTDTVEGHYLDNLTAELAGDERAGRSLRGQPSAADLIRSIRGKSFNYQSAALQKEARKHPGPLGDRLNQAADDLIRLGRGTADRSVVDRSLQSVDTPRVNPQDGGMTSTTQNAPAPAEAKRMTVSEAGLQDGDKVWIFATMSNSGVGFTPKNVEAGKPYLATVRSHIEDRYGRARNVRVTEFIDENGNEVGGGAPAASFWMVPVRNAPAVPASGDNIARHTTAPVSMDIFEGGSGQLDIAGQVYDIHRDNSGRAWVADHMEGDAEARSFTAANPADLARKVADHHGVTGPVSIEDERSGGKATQRFEHTAKTTLTSTGPGNVPIGGTDADRAAARPRMENETDRAYAVRTAPTREAALSLLNGHQAAGLRAIARDEGVVTSGTKADLVARLIRAMRDRHADSVAIERMVNRDRAPAAPKVKAEDLRKGDMVQVGDTWGLVQGVQAYPGTDHPTEVQVSYDGGARVEWVELSTINAHETRRGNVPAAGGSITPTMTGSQLIAARRKLAAEQQGANRPKA